MQTIEERQGLKVACPEEIAFANQWIDRDALLTRAREYRNNAYGRYLESLADAEAF
jgi:glucose-1-phosphate thymidylyltransferase